MTRPLLIVAAALLLLPTSAWAIEKVSIRREGKVLKLEGKVVQEDQAGGIMLLATDGVIWNIAAAEVVDRKTDAQPFKPLSRDELGVKVLGEMPSGCKVHTTEHYVICYNTSEAYAKFCGGLFERLYVAFFDFWKDLGWELSEPELPLVALVFDDKASFDEFAPPKLSKTIVAYYNLDTNRVAMYDLTGVELRPKKGKKPDEAMVRAFLSTPKSSFNVATIIHEATHQLTFNCGLHHRFADIPLWVLEGMAVYFETPDLRKDAKGWSTIGQLNTSRLKAFRTSLGERKRAGGLERLLTDDKRFQNPSEFSETYGEAWAFNYYLFEKHKVEYVDYLRVLAKKEPGIVDEPGERMNSFKAIFGKDLKQLDVEFLKYMTTVK